MFNFFKSKKYEPLDQEQREYFDHNLDWMCHAFPEPTVENRKILTLSDFPINWSNTEEDAWAAMKIIADNMQLSTDEITLHFYDDGLQEIDMGTNVLFLENDKETPETLGLYLHKNEEGKYDIALATKNLQDPETLIATMAHEFAHIKLLGEQKLVDNDEFLTDLITVFFGLGIFNANNSFNFYTKTDRWGFRANGYLSINQWAYALARYAFIRYEDDPQWSKHLSKSIKPDFDKSLKYLLEKEKEEENKG